MQALQNVMLTRCVTMRQLSFGYGENEALYELRYVGGWRMNKDEGVTILAPAIQAEG
jgi:hypothetical protein